MDKLQALADKISTETIERLKKEKLDCPCNIDNAIATVKKGNKYTKIDVGNSGKYMVTKEGEIFGIKAYGVIHHGHFYGTLDTINDYYWGNYTAQKVKK